MADSTSPAQPDILKVTTELKQQVEEFNTATLNATDMEEKNVLPTKQDIVAEKLATANITPEKIAPENIVPEKIVLGKIVPENIASDKAPEIIAPEKLEPETFVLAETDNLSKTPTTFQ